MENRCNAIAVCIFLYLGMSCLPAFAEDSAEGIEQINASIKSGDIDTIDSILTNKKMKSSVRNELLNAALLSAARFGSVEMMDYLIEELNGDEDVRDQGERTLVHIAAYGDNFEVLKYLIEEHKLDPEALNGFDLTPLHWLTSDVNIARYLVEEQRVDLEAKGLHGRTPLASAAQHNSYELFCYLIDAGADCSEGAVMKYAMQSSDPRILKRLEAALGTEPTSAEDLTKSEAIAQLRGAIAAGDIVATRNLAEEHSLQIDHLRFPDDEWSPLQLAIYENKFGVVKFMYEHYDPDPSFKFWDDKLSALQWASYYCRTEIMEYLMSEEGFDPLDIGSTGRDSFWYVTASTVPRVDAFELLMKTHRFDIEKKDQAGQTALLRAAFCNRVPVLVKHLIEKHNADVTAIDSAGHSVYQCAARCSQNGTPTLKYLVEKFHPDIEEEFDAVFVKKLQDAETRNYLLSLLNQ